MNTPSHVIVNVAVLAKSRYWPLAWCVVLGALAPDAPMFLFYLIEKFVVGQPEAVIWSEIYFEQGWQDVFDVWNSIPLFFIGFLLAVITKKTGTALFCASALLHCLLDLPLHHDDGHRHFFPFSDFRYASPISYWDPAHFGQVFAAIEIIIAAVATVVIWRKKPRLWAKVAMGLNFIAYTGLYVYFYLLEQAPF